MEKNCFQCGGLFNKLASHSLKAWADVKYCSLSCYNASKKGKPMNVGDRSSRAPWNLGIKMGKSPRNTRVKKECIVCGKEMQIPKARKDSAKFCSFSCKGKAMDKGLTSENQLIRHSAPYRHWRASVFKRDAYTCQHCFVVGGRLNADHIIPFSIDKEKRLDLDNGITLCESCHRKTATFGRRALKFSQAQQP